MSALSAALRRASIFSVFSLALLLPACANLPVPMMGDGFRPSKRDVASYETVGRQWGAKHWNSAVKAGSVDDAFVQALIDSDNLDFFWVHADLKDAFRKGYRIGYQDRTADLVLGPNVTAAAKTIGERSSSRFVAVVDQFERDWAATIKRAVDVFITLISEGAQADREQFITNFERIYREKYDKTQQALRAGGFVQQTSEGGTLLFLDARSTVAVLNIPSPQTLKTEIYQQTFKVMGDEWGRRYSHNLVKRDELVDLLRRSKTAFEEVSPGLAGNLGIVQEAFKISYGTDAVNVFSSLVREAGYSTMPSAATPAPSTTGRGRR